MYEFYVIAHFVLMLVWLVVAVILDFRFLRNFRQVTDEGKLALLKNMRSISDKTEMPTSFFLPLVGVLLLIENTFWLKIGIMHGKIALALVVIGLFHASRATMRKMMNALETSAPVEKLANRYMILRMIVLVLLVVIVGMIVSYKGTFSTIILVRSWFS